MLTVSLWIIMTITGIIAFITGANCINYAEKHACKSFNKKRYTPIVLSLTGIILTFIIIIDESVDIGFDHDLYEIFHASFNMIVFALFHTNALNNLKKECNHKDCCSDCKKKFNKSIKTNKS